MKNLSISIELAEISDAVSIQILVNKAYSSRDEERSWTNESKVVEGERISLEQTQALFSAQDTAVLVAKHQNVIVGTVTLIQGKGVAKLNMLAVSPAYQQYGIGKQLLSFSERFVRDKFQCTAIRIDVVSSRKELISFYQRWGFINCNIPYPYPTHLVATKPFDKDLEVHVFEKTI